MTLIKTACTIILFVTFTFSLLSDFGSLLQPDLNFGANKDFSKSWGLMSPAPKTGDYQNSIVKGKLLSAVDLQEDALLLKKVMLDVHPDIYRYNTEKEFEAHFQTFFTKLSQDMTEAEFMKHVAQFTEKVRCGHTYLNPWNMKEEIRDRLFGGNIYLPFGFVIDDRRLYITKNASNNNDIMTGAEIISINGFSASSILDSLYTVAKVDGSNVQAKDKLLELTAFGERDYNFFDFYFPLFFPMQEEIFEVTVQNYGSDEIIRHRQPALSRTERMKIMTSTYGPVPTGKETWSLDMQEEMAILKLGTFATWRFENFDAAQFYDSVFTMVNQNGVENLVIDIRGNGGGLSENRYLLLSHLSEEPIPCSENRKELVVTTQADSSYRNYVQTRDEIIFEGLPETYTRPYNSRFSELLEGGCEPIQPSGNHFSGKLYILGNQSNVSSTFSLLNTIQKENLGTYVGQPSGGNREGINGGSYLFLYLPNSQFEIDIPLKFTSYGEDAEDGYLPPDVWVEIDQKDIAFQKDPYIEKVKSLIKH
ncbi:MAG: hypothetical protein GVY08_13075 [Bacteroidetes bacterium]|jgi:hypothetical protein|nr:hypothetical protein [Bacteroidota bacterium]